MALNCTVCGILFEYIILNWSPSRLLGLVDWHQLFVSNSWPQSTTTAATAAVAMTTAVTTYCTWPWGQQQLVAEVDTRPLSLHSLHGTESTGTPVVVVCGHRAWDCGKVMWTLGCHVPSCFTFVLLFQFHFHFLGEVGLSTSLKFLFSYHQYRASHCSCTVVKERYILI